MERTPVMGRTLAELRKHRGLTVQQVAERAAAVRAGGAPGQFELGDLDSAEIEQLRKAIAYYERQERTVRARPDILEPIAQAIGADVDALGTTIAFLHMTTSGPVDFGGHLVAFSSLGDAFDRRDSLLGAGRDWLVVPMGMVAIRQMAAENLPSEAVALAAAAIVRDPSRELWQQLCVLKQVMEGTPPGDVDVELVFVALADAPDIDLLKIARRERFRAVRHREQGRDELADISERRARFLADAIQLAAGSSYASASTDD